ncbi:MAG: cyclic nucleotide-binding domain-containing protein [Desulfobacteraceae bacterium]
MNGIENILAGSVVFSRAGAEGRQRIASIAQKWSVREGETLASPGQKASSFFLLGSGTLMLSMEEERALVLNTPGDFIAMELLSSKGVYKTRVTVLSGGHVYALERDAFLEMIREDSADAETVMHAWKTFLENTAPFVKKQDHAVTGFEYAY